MVETDLKGRDITDPAVLTSWVGARQLFVARDCRNPPVTNPLLVQRARPSPSLI